MHVATLALSLFALASPATGVATSSTAAAVGEPVLVVDAPFVVLAQADPAEEILQDPPPPPALPEDPEEQEELSAPPPAAPTAPPEPGAGARVRERSRDARPGDDAVNPMLAAGITAGTGIVFAVPAAALCGTCSCFACPGPLACVPVLTAGGAAAGLVFAGADFGDALLPAFAAGVISLGSGILGIGAVLLVGIVSGTATNLAGNAGVDPNVISSVGLFGVLLNAGVMLAFMSAGAAGAGAAVYFMAPDSEEAGVVVDATELGEGPLPRNVLASAMAY